VPKSIGWEIPEETIVFISFIYSISTEIYWIIGMLSTHQLVFAQYQRKMLIELVVYQTKWKCHKSNPPRMGNHLQKHVGIEPTKVWKVDQANMRYKRIKNGDLNRFNMISSLTNNKLMWIYQIKHQQILGNLRVSNVECHMIGGADGFHCNRCKETRSTQPRGWPPALWPSKFRDEFHSSCGDTGYTSS